MSEAKMQLVRGLVEQAPDTAIRSLMMALGSEGVHEGALGDVQQIVETEAADRRTRNLVFSPIAPLCAPPGPYTGLSFPRRTLSLLWKAVKADAEHETGAALAQSADWRPQECAPDLFNGLCARAAAGLRERSSPAYAQAADLADAGGGSETLAACLDLAAVARAALERVPDWLGRMTSEKSAHLRLAYKDVVRVAEDGGPRFFEMLAAHLTEPWLILRVISGVMDRPGEAYLAGSELAGFGTRVLADIDRRVAEVAALKATSGAAAARSAADSLHFANVQIAEIEQHVALHPDGAWGRRIAQQKRAIAIAAETHLKLAEGAVNRALPVQTTRIGPAALRGGPKLTDPPDPILVGRAQTLMTFLSEVRASAAPGGFASVRAKVLESLEERLDQYVEDILGEIRSDDVVDRDRARAYLEIAADFCGLARDEKAAQIVRRRAAA